LLSVAPTREDASVTSLHQGSGTPPVLSDALRALVGYAERNPATQADVDQVMRALASHDGWYVPIVFADRAWGQTHFDQVLSFPEAAPGTMVLVFTDDESAMLADGEAIGAYGGPVDGCRLLSVLDGNVEALVVNHASPREHQWYIASPGFPIAVSWATAIAAERALAGLGGAGGGAVGDLLAHRYHLLLEKATHGLAQIYLPDVDGAVGVCFTASDRAQEFLSSLPREARASAGFARIDGRQLFEMMRGIGAAGLVVNAGSGDQTALTGEDIADIVAPRSMPR
jgi:hypothetical protein